MWEAEAYEITDLTPHRPCVHRGWLVWGAGTGVQCRWGWWGHWADDPHPPHQPQHHNAPHCLLEHISSEWVLLPVLVLCHSFPCSQIYKIEWEFHVSCNLIPPGFLRSPLLWRKIIFKYSMLYLFLLLIFVLMPLSCLPCWKKMQGVNQ